MKIKWYKIPHLGNALQSLSSLSDREIENQVFVAYYLGFNGYTELADVVAKFDDAEYIDFITNQVE